MPNKQVVGSKQLDLGPLDLVATTVHELKSPLTLITGLAAMLEAGQFGPLNLKQRRYLGRISNVSERLTTLVEGLLSVSRSQHRRSQLQLEPISINSVVQAVLEELEPASSSSRISIAWQPIKHLEPVLADRDCLYQIIYNLVDNSLKYSPADTVITIKLRHHPNKLFLRISDQGVGIKPNELKHLFRRFGKISQPVGSQAGSSGLGLFIVKKLVEAQGGSVRVQTLKQGTCFIVELPIAQQLGLFVLPEPRLEKPSIKKPLPAVSFAAKSQQS